METTHQAPEVSRMCNRRRKFFEVSINLYFLSLFMVLLLDKGFLRYIIFITRNPRLHSILTQPQGAPRGRIRELHSPLASFDCSWGPWFVIQ